MGWTVLYLAFGLVALWLLGEVLFQHKARLRWRLLAFTGFLGVVIGVLVSSVPVIGAGAIAFAVGQTQVTLSFRRGFTTGWALSSKGVLPGGRRGDNRRRRARPRGAQPPAEPALHVSDLAAGPYGDGPAADDPTHTPGQDGYRDAGTYDAYGTGSYDAYGGHGAHGSGPDAGGPGPDGYPAQPAAVPGGWTVDGPPVEGPPVHAPQPLPDETGQYGIYSPDARPRATGHPDDSGYDVFGNPTAQEALPNDLAHGGSYGDTGQGGAGTPDPAYAPYGTADPYATTGSYGTPGTPGTPGTGAPYAADPYGYGAATGPYGTADPYAPYGDAPGGGQAPGQQPPHTAPYADSYADPYAGGAPHSAPYDAYGQPDPFGHHEPSVPQQHDGRGAGGHGQPHGGDGPLGQPPEPGYRETPPGGVWVPQQRDAELPPEQPPYPPYQQQGHDEQQPYRY